MARPAVRSYLDLYSGCTHNSTCHNTGSNLYFARIGLLRLFPILNDGVQVITESAYPVEVSVDVYRLAKQTPAAYGWTLANPNGKGNLSGGLPLLVFDNFANLEFK